MHQWLTPRPREVLSGLLGVPTVPLNLLIQSPTGAIAGSSYQSKEELYRGALRERLTTRHLTAPSGVWSLQICVINIYLTYPPPSGIQPASRQSSLGATPACRRTAVAKLFCSCFSLRVWGLFACLLARFCFTTISP